MNLFDLAQGFDGEKIAENEQQKLALNLWKLIPSCSLWVSPETVKSFVEHRPEWHFKFGRRVYRITKDLNGNAIKKNMRTKKRLGDEEVEILSDNNTGANHGFKWALLGTSSASERSKLRNMSVCHIWDKTVDTGTGKLKNREPRLGEHTHLANMVLLPTALAGLSDFDWRTRWLLQYRAYKLYDYLPCEIKPLAKPCWDGCEYDELKWACDQGFFESRYVKTRANKFKQSITKLKNGEHILSAKDEQPK